jgi:hypothetical protein
VIALFQSDDINYQFKINYKKHCYSYSLNSVFECTLNNASLNIFFLPIPLKKLGFERIKNFQNWLKKAKFYKKIYLKTLLKMNKEFYNRQLKKQSNVRLEKPKLLKLKSKISYAHKSKWKAYKQFYSFPRQQKGQEFSYKGQKKLKKTNQRS